MLNQSDLRDFLEEKLEHYNQSWFIECDPVSIPHQYTKKQDIEISGLFSSTLAWGNRAVTIQSVNKLMQLMDNEPYQFVSQSTEKDYCTFRNFKHRTFNYTDLVCFLQTLKVLYNKHSSLEEVFFPVGNKEIIVRDGILHFRKDFFAVPHQSRTEKHLANPLKNASAKRLNMFLRWMVRKDNRGVDFGIWERISPSVLMCPLDVHSSGVARKLGLMRRKTNDWKAVEELTSSLRVLDPQDPVKYDLALFSLGIFEKFAQEIK